MTFLRIVLMSDTHEHHREVEIPRGDLLIHAGDITRHSFSSRPILDFNDWLSGLPHRHKIVVPGNHDYGFMKSSWRQLITNATLLINDGAEIAGLKIWGSPITTVDHGHFGGETEQDRMRAFSLIPANLDILITHGPPFGVLDLSPDDGRHQGCSKLREAVRRTEPPLHVFGHVHGGYGVAKIGNTVYVNAALPADGYRPNKSPIVLDIDISGPTKLVRQYTDVA